MNTGIKTAGGKEIQLGDIVRRHRRNGYSFPDNELNKKWRIECRFVLVDVDTGKQQDVLQDYHNGQFVIVTHKEVQS